MDLSETPEEVFAEISLLFSSTQWNPNVIKDQIIQFFYNFTDFPFMENSQIFIPNIITWLQNTEDCKNLISYHALEICYFAPTMWRYYIDLSC